MKRIKEIAMKTFQSIPQDQGNPEKWIDAFVLAYTRAILIEATDVIRSKAKDYNNETGIILKSTAIDVLDHFEL